MEQKETYSLEELFDNLPIPLSELGRRGNINEVTLARIRDGYSARRSTIVRLLTAFSSVYDQTLTLKNVTGLLIRDKKAQAAYVSEKAKNLPITTPTSDYTGEDTKAQKSPTERKQTRASDKLPVPDDLPEGTLDYRDFANKYTVNHRTFRGWITDKKFPAEVRDNKSRPGETLKFLTPEQQGIALLWMNENSRLFKPSKENE